MNQKLIKYLMDVKTMITRSKAFDVNYCIMFLSVEFLSQ